LIRSRRADAHQNTMTTLFDSISLGDLDLPNRIIMAPLTRSRAGASRIANMPARRGFGQPSK
jgi:2,4-dienoyl-CoA reductase-like NADH-dependent reductase (Old Yellow Enzyme family)